MIKITKADYDNARHARAILDLLNSYSLDPMGQAEPLSDFTRKNLIDGLKSTPGSFVLLAFKNDKPAGIATCFTGFSTFKAKKLANIHDLAVAPDFRGMGIGHKLLQAVEDHCRSVGFCKITLEVRDDNRAKNLYERFGFRPGEPEMLFWAKEF